MGLFFFLSRFGLSAGYDYIDNVVLTKANAEIQKHLGIARTAGRNEQICITSCKQEVYARKEEQVNKKK